MGFFKDMTIWILDSS